MVDAYIDESGIHEGAHVCVIACFWGSVNKWKRFERRWNKILETANEPALHEFHSTEFWYSDGRRKGLFAKWTDKKADKFIDDLVNCVVESRVFPTSAILVTADWKKLNKDERMFATGGRYDTANRKWLATGAPNRVYFLPFQVAIEYPAMACPDGLHVHYVLDLNKQFKKHAIDLFQLMKNDPKIKCRHRMGGIDFETSDKYPGLQAADLLAYQTYQFSRQRIASGRGMKKSEMPPILRKLLTHMRTPHDFPFFDSEGLNVVLHNLPTDLRSPGWKPVKLK